MEPDMPRNAQIFLLGMCRPCHSLSFVSESFWIVRARAIFPGMIRASASPPYHNAFLSFRNAIAWNTVWRVAELIGRAYLRRYSAPCVFRAYVGRFGGIRNTSPVTSSCRTISTSSGKSCHSTASSRWRLSASVDDWLSNWTFAWGT